MKYRELAVKDEKDLVFGNAPRPVKTGRGLEIGGGKVYPELNFTVPEGIPISRDSLSDLVKMYGGIADEALKRTLELRHDGIVLEFETLVEMTEDPFIGVEICRELERVCASYYERYGLKAELRLTPNDSRDFKRPPKMRTGEHIEKMLQLFDEGSKAGGNFLSIETTGGKEICDDAILNGNIRLVVFALAVLGVRDMRFIWPKIVGIAKKNGKIAGGDTACGFANTAMVLAEKGYIPRLFSALVRVISVVRSLVAVEEGARGPDKDCGYEGVYLKAIAGIPVSMEGKTSACAHLSPVGNIAGACADLWSNESVQNIKLLGGMAPTVYTEQLIYDVRLMNTSIRKGTDEALALRNLLVDSDKLLDSQAFVLDPDTVIRVSREMLRAETHLEAALRGALKALALMEDAVSGGRLLSSERENLWFDILRRDIEAIPTDESELLELVMPEIDIGKIDLGEYLF